MKVVREGEVLQSKTRKGDAKFWQGIIWTEGKDYFIGSRHWQITSKDKTSKIQESVPYLVTPKNVGKANETTSKSQADSEFDSMIDKQLDKGYLPEGEEADPDKLPLPMTAKKFQDQKHKIKYPCYVQPKLNGQRVIFDGAHSMTRQGNEVLPEVMAHLAHDLGVWTMSHGNIRVKLDGELMLPNNVLLQESMKAIKKYRPDVSPTLLYHVYDLAEGEFTFKERYTLLASMIPNLPKNIKLVETHLVTTEAEIEAWLDKFIEQGYEGIMIRNVDGKYQPNQRSNDLQKFKRFIDSEFKIVGLKEGEGQYKGCGIFNCVTKKGIAFDCVPEGTIEEKKEYYENRKKLIGKWLTIRYHGLTEDGVPFPNPVGIEVRETEKGGY